ncbi:anti-sigma factor domain-containing protein [Agreia sp. COWG]|uniref:anti-sigma factor n=1 Tax=Agreia sp. COWG TaxID=2773266 RepID=UPI0019297EC3|nr:anti-sigma factor [Agreia sp. COWG]CAD6003830.1 Anti-sigma-K factor rskA [Agreia sp. COWG]
MTVDDDARLNTGAFALGALSPDEVERFIAATAADSSLADEAAELGETAVLLGLAATPVAPSPQLKTDLMAAIASTPQLPALQTQGDVVDPVAVEGSRPVANENDSSGVASTKARVRWFARPGTLLASAAAAVALFIGGGFVGAAVTGEAPAAVDAQAAGLASIYAASDVQSARSEVSGGGSATLVWSGELGRSAVVVDGLAPLPAGSVYEAWYINDAGAAPAGTFDATGAHKTSWHLLDGSMSAGDTVGVTVEPAGGSKTPTTTPIVAIASA